MPCSARSLPAVPRPSTPRSRWPSSSVSRPTPVWRVREAQTMSTQAIPYRVFELPWTPSAADERRYRRVLHAALGLFIGFGIVIPFLPTHRPTLAQAPAVPERIVEFILEQPKPKPTPEIKVV